MSRRPFNNTMSVKYGPTSTVGTPGSTYRTGVQCRPVYQEQIVQEEYPNDLSMYWITYSLPLLNFVQSTPMVGGQRIQDFNTADRLTFGSVLSGEYTALRSERVYSTGGPSYGRALICLSSDFPPAPVNPPLRLAAPPPGPDCAGAPTLIPGYVYTYTATAPGLYYWKWFLTAFSTRTYRVVEFPSGFGYAVFFKGPSCPILSADAYFYAPGSYQTSTPYSLTPMAFGYAGGGNGVISFGVMPY